MLDVKPPLTDQINALKRDRILEAAVQVFAERGFHRAKVKDVAKAAGIADGTVYNHFASKDELLLGILERLNESGERPKAFAEGSNQDFKTFFTAYLRHRLEFIFENAETFQALLPELISNPELRARYLTEVIAPTTRLAERYFAAQVEVGTMKRLNVPLATRAVSGMVLGLLVQLMLGDEELRTRWHELPEVLAGLILEGLGA